MGNVTVKPLPPLGEELFEHYPMMSAQTHEALVKEYAKKAVRAALSVPCLQEPVGWLIEHGGTKCITLEKGNAEAYGLSSLTTVTPLYAQPIEVREQAIEALQPFARFSDVIEHNARHHASDQTVMFEQKGDEYGCLTLGDFRRASLLLALLEGR